MKIDQNIADRMVRFLEKVTGKTLVHIDGDVVSTYQDAEHVYFTGGTHPEFVFMDVVHELAHYAASTPEDRKKPNICFEGYVKGGNTPEQDAHYMREEMIGAVVVGRLLGLANSVLTNYSISAHIQDIQNQCIFNPKYEGVVEQAMKRLEVFDAEYGDELCRQFYFTLKDDNPLAPAFR